MNRHVTRQFAYAQPLLGGDLPERPKLRVGDTAFILYALKMAFCHTDNLAEAHEYTQRVLLVIRTNTPRVHAHPAGCFVRSEKCIDVYSRQIRFGANI